MWLQEFLKVNNQLRDLDALALFSGFLGVLNYTENLKQTSNDELMEELKQETNLKLNTIIEQNNEIIRLLKEGK
jgi:hypothetical protein